MSSPSREQRLVDICFQLVYTAAGSKVIQRMAHEERMAWVADQLRKSGFDTEPMGISWGVLK